MQAQETQTQEMQAQQTHDQQTGVNDGPTRQSQRGGIKRADGKTGGFVIVELDARQAEGIGQHRRKTGEDRNKFPILQEHRRQAEIVAVCGEREVQRQRHEKNVDGEKDQLFMEPGEACHQAECM